MALSQCEIGLIVALGLLAFIFVLFMYQYHANGYRGFLTSCASVLTGATAPAVSVTRMDTRINRIEDVPVSNQMQGPMASVGEIIDLQGGLPGAAAMEDFGEGYADATGRLNMIEDAPHGDMMPSGAASGDLYSYADNLIPISADDPATIYSASSAYNAHDTYGGSNSGVYGDGYGQSVGSAAVGRIEIGRRPEDAQGASYMLRNYNTDSQRSQDAYFRSQCRSICLPHNHPESWPRGISIPSGLASRCGPCTEYV